MTRAAREAEGHERPANYDLIDKSVGLVELRRRRKEVKAALGPVNHTQDPRLLDFRDWLSHRGRIKLGDLVARHRNGQPYDGLGRVIVMDGGERICQVTWGVKRLGYNEREDYKSGDWYPIEDLLTIKRPRSIKDEFVGDEWILVSAR